MTSIELPERLTADGIALRRLRADDASAYAAAFRDDPNLGRLLGVDEDPAEDAIAARADRAAERARAGTFLELAIADPQTDAFWGTVLLHSFDERHRRCEVGFWLIPAERRRGMGAAAVSLIVSWAMEQLDLLRVEMTTTPDNAAVDALAAKLGFTREGVLRKRNVERGERVDVVWYGVLREEWQRG